MARRRRVNVYVSEDTIARLRQMAADLGMTVAVGREVGKGNVSALLEAIAAGEVVPAGALVKDPRVAAVEAVVAEWRRELREEAEAMRQERDMIEASYEELAREVEALRAAKHDL